MRNKPDKRTYVFSISAKTRQKLSIKEASWTRVKPNTFTVNPQTIVEMIPEHCASIYWGRVLTFVSLVSSSSSMLVASRRGPKRTSWSIVGSSRGEKFGAPGHLTLTLTLTSTKNKHHKTTSYSTCRFTMFHISP